MKQYTLNSENTSINLKIDYQKELNKEQFDVVTGGDGPCLVLAGAGSGKTRTLVYRVAYLIENGVDPRRILLVTFTNKAAKEMLNRIEVLLGGSVAGLWGGTFHHIGNRLLRTYGRNIGIEPNFNILDDEDSKALVKSCVSAMRVPDDKYFPKSDLIHKIISLSANLSRPIEEVLSTRFSQIDEIYFPILINIETAYQKKKRESNALDYDDLLSKWNELLVKAPEVRQKLSEQFQYILVDEYQDTNYLQGEAIRHLASQHQNILVVGDDSQSIYSFRGADVNNILSFPKVFKDSHTYRLESNYRSTPEILSLANLSIKNNKKQFDKTLHAHKASGQKPALVALEDNQAQAKFICQRIVDLERDENIPLGKIAVLFRAHYLSLELELELNRRNIAYVMRGGLRFFEQAHVKDILAYLKIINNFKDEVSWARILRFQDGIGGASANKIWQIISAQDSFSEVLRHDFQSDVSLRVYNGWMKSREIFSRLLSIEPNKLSDLIEKIIHSGYEDYLKGSFDNFNDRIADLEQLSVFAGGYESLEKFLSDTALSEGFKGEATAGSGGNSTEAVTLSTIHQAKGLEWTAVFVIGLIDGQFPGAKSMSSQNDIEEERRLFYVAVTRAESQLYLTYTLFSSYGQNLAQMSQFIKELPESAYEEWQVAPSSKASYFGSSQTFFTDNSKIKNKKIDDNEVRYVSEDESDEDDVSANFWQRVIAKRKN